MQYNTWTLSLLPFFVLYNQSNFAYIAFIKSSKKGMQRGIHYIYFLKKSRIYSLQPVTFTYIVNFFSLSSISDIQYRKLDTLSTSSEHTQVHLSAFNRAPNSYPILVTSTIKEVPSCTKSFQFYVAYISMGNWKINFHVMNYDASG